MKIVLGLLEAYLALYSEITGLSKSETKERSNELMSLVGLDWSKKRVKVLAEGIVRW